MTVEAHELVQDLNAAGYVVLPYRLHNRIKTAWYKYLMSQHDITFKRAAVSDSVS